MVEKVEVVEHLEWESFALAPLNFVPAPGVGKAEDHLHQSLDRMIAIRGSYSFRLHIVS